MLLFRIVKTRSKSEGCAPPRAGSGELGALLHRSGKGRGALFHMGICSNRLRLCYTSLNISFRGPSPGAAGAAG